MIIIGLTGSIGMGKSETAKMLAKLGIPVLDSDAVVHALYAPGGAAVTPVAAEFPEVFRDGVIDRGLLLKRIAGEPAALARLEQIVHPLVRDEQERFLARCREEGCRLAVLDIPLLFETGRDRDMDKIIVVTAPAEIQRQRVLARPGMTEEKLAAILARQMPDEEKRRRADFLVDSAQGFDNAAAQVRHIVETLIRGS